MSGSSKMPTSQQPGGVNNQFAHHHELDEIYENEDEAIEDMPDVRRNEAHLQVH